MENENIEKKKKLHEKLGELTYEIAKLKTELNKKVQHSNQIAQELEELDGK